MLRVMFLVSNTEDLTLDRPVLDPPGIDIAEADPDGLVNEQQRLMGYKRKRPYFTSTVAAIKQLDVVQPNGVEMK